MNVFVGVGHITEVQPNGRALKFNFELQQDKPCTIPCLMFDPDDEIKELVQQLEQKEQVVWLQGKLFSNEYEFKGKTINKLQLIVHPRNIKAI